MVKGTEDDDFKRLQRLGFNFDGPRDEDEFQSQPDSGSMIGGVRGAMEYGIHEDVTLMEPDEPVPVDEVEAGDLEYDPEPLPYGDPNDQLVGTSEWSNSAAFRPEEIVERAEPMFNHDAEGSVTRSKDVTVPRTYVRGRKSNEQKNREEQVTTEEPSTKPPKRDQPVQREDDPDRLWSGLLALGGCVFCGVALALSYHYTTSSMFRSRSTRKYLW